MKRILSILLTLITVSLLFSCSENVSTETSAETTEETKSKGLSQYIITSKANTELPEIVLEAIRAYHGVNIGAPVTYDMLKSVNTLTFRYVDKIDDQIYIDACVNDSCMYAIGFAPGINYIAKERFTNCYHDPITDLNDKAESDPDFTFNGYNSVDIEFMYSNFFKYYELKDPSKPGLSEKAKEDILTTFHIIKEKGPVYVLETSIPQNERRSLLNGFDLINDVDHCLGPEVLDLSSLEYLPELTSVTVDEGINITNWTVNQIPVKAKCGDGTTWSLENNILTISGYGNMWDFVDENGTFILELPWKDLEFTEVVIEDGVTSVGNGAFSHFNNITKVTLGNNIRTIGREAFNSCTGIESIVIPDTVSDINEKSFFHCENLKSVELPSNLYSIGSQAFSNCVSLGDITIPENTENMMQDAFVNCSSITDFFVDENNDTYQTIDGTIIINRQGTLYMYPEGKMQKTYSIPEGIYIISEYAFNYNNNLTEIVIPTSVISLAQVDFSKLSNLESITVLNYNLKYCDVDGILYNKEKTELIAYPSNRIEETYTLPAEITYIHPNAFKGCEYIKKLIINSESFLSDFSFLENAKNIESIEYNGEIIPTNILIEN